MFTNLILNVDQLHEMWNSFLNTMMDLSGFVEVSPGSPVLKGPGLFLYKQFSQSTKYTNLSEQTVRYHIVHCR